MTTEPLRVIAGGLTGDAPLDTAISRAILRQVDDATSPETLQVGAPHRVVAFGKHDAINPRFAEAVEIAESHGYDVTVRIAGGRAVVFHPGTVRFAWTVPEPEPARFMHRRFEALSDAVVAALAGLGVASSVGELPNEYCAGSYSVHLEGGGKVMGVGQRLSRRAAQVGGMIVIDDPESINTVLEPIYRVLALPFDPEMTGAISHVASLDPGEVSTALTAEIAKGRTTFVGSVDARTLDLARSMRDDHVPQHLRERAEPS